MQRKRPVGTEDAEEVDPETGNGAAVSPGRETGQRGRSEGERRLLPEAHRIVGSTDRVSQPRPVWMKRLDAAQGEEEVVVERPLRQRRIESAQILLAIALPPGRFTRVHGPARITGLPGSMREFLLH